MNCFIIITPVHRNRFYLIQQNLAQVGAELAQHDQTLADNAQHAESTEIQGIPFTENLRQQGRLG